MPPHEIIGGASALVAVFADVNEKELECLAELFIRYITHELRREKHGEYAHGFHEPAGNILRECRYQLRLSRKLDQCGDVSAHHFNYAHVHIAGPRPLEVERISVKNDVSKELMHRLHVVRHPRDLLMRHSWRKLNAGDIFKVAFDGRIQLNGLAACHRIGVDHPVQHGTNGTIRNLPRPQTVAVIGYSLRYAEYLTRAYARKD